MRTNSVAIDSIACSEEMTAVAGASILIDKHAKAAAQRPARVEEVSSHARACV
jgi:hypothetical protein